MRAASLVLALFVAACPEPPPSTGCNSDSDCDAGDVCSNGVCQPFVPQDCEDGFHDGGDGRCAPLGECSDGFERFFIDEDLDGHGSALLGDDCASAPPLGFAIAGDDCDDLDDAIFTLATFPFDLDGDGRSAPRTVCAGAAVPVNALPAPFPSSTLLVHPTSAVVGEIGEPWSNPGRVSFTDGQASSARVRRDKTTRTLTLAGLGCSVPLSAALSGVTLHLVGRATGVSGANDAVTSLTLSQAGLSASGEATHVWSTEVSDIAQPFGFGGEVAALDPCAPDFTLTITLRGIELDKDVQVDEVYLEVFGVDDCDDDDDSIFMPLHAHADLDLDGMSGPDAELVCVASRADVTTPNVRAVDCDDADANARPGQTQFFGEPRASVGGFDFNCDGVDEPKAIAPSTCSVDPISGACSSSGQGSFTAECGADVDVDVCDTNNCGVITQSVRETCR